MEDIEFANGAWQIIEENLDADVYGSLDFSKEKDG